MSFRKQPVNGMHFFATCCKFTIDEEAQQSLISHKNNLSKREKVSLHNFENTSQHLFRKQSPRKIKQMQKINQTQRFTSADKRDQIYHNIKTLNFPNIYSESKHVPQKLNFQNCRYRASYQDNFKRNSYLSPATGHRVSYQQAHRTFNSPFQQRFQSYLCQQSSRLPINSKKLNYESDNQNFLEKTKKISSFSSNFLVQKESELRQTKNVGKIQLNKNLQNELLNFKESIVSVNEMNEQKVEVLQESVILMDFFNPTESKLKEIESKSKNQNYLK